MWIVSLERHPGDACHSRDIHLHTHPPDTNDCEAHWGSRWKGNVSIGTLNMPHNITEWHLRFQMNVTRRMKTIQTRRPSKQEDHPDRKGHPSMYGEPTPHRGSAETKTYRSLLNSRKLRLPEDNLSSSHIGDNLRILVHRAVQH